MRNIISATVVTLAGVFSFQTQALAGTGDTSWMSQGKYGIFMHYQYRILLGHSVATKPQFPSPSQMTAEEWNRFVDGFDVKGFAQQMAEGRVGWVIFCLDDHYFAWPCAPNKAFSDYTGYGPGEKCSRRDLILDVADALNDKGVKLICYFAGLNGYMKEPNPSWGDAATTFFSCQLQAWVAPVKPGTPPRVAKAPAGKVSAGASEAGSRDDPSPWGMGSGAEWSGDYPRFNPMLEKAGVKWIRLFPEWQVIQPRQGQWGQEGPVLTGPPPPHGT